MRTHNHLLPAYPIHPGEILKDMLEDREWTQTELAERMHRPLQLINGIINGRKGITADTALDLAEVFDMSPEFWVNLESNYQLEMARLRRQERKAS